MPVGQSGESQQWITSSMRLLSLAARGGFLERALADMRKVAWDRGPVRLGTYSKADGTPVPLWHDSEVAAIAYAIQNIIARRKGEPVPALATPATAQAAVQRHGRREVSRVRRPRHDPQGRLRLLHSVRPRGGLRMSVVVQPTSSSGAGWRWSHVLQAPHRLGFLLAMVVLAASGSWWALVQLHRLGLPVALTYAVSPSLAHSAVMTFGFIPLFFAGFLFTAGPRWLGMRAPSAGQLSASLLAQAGGWLLWLLGTHLHVLIAFAGLALAAAGLTAMTLRFWRMVGASDAPDRLHAKAIAGALAWGCLCLAGMGMAVLLDAQAAARGLVLSGIWGCVVVVFVAVAHRMIPFFTSSAVPMLHAWRPEWVLALMLGTALFEAAAVWVDMALAGAIAWLLLRGVLEIGAGLVLLWLAVAWGLVQSLRIRLLAMLHLGFLWLGLALLLGGLSQLLAAFTGQAVLPLAPLHALTMGCLGSLMLAMVTRVSCGHSGRALVADNLVWSLFWLLQAAVLLRILAALPAAGSQALLATAASLWAAVMMVWGVRYGNWYGRARADGRPG